MIHPYFRLSEKTREYSTRVIIFAALVIFFKIYKIPAAKLGLIEIPASVDSQDPAGPILRVEVIFAIISFYYYLLLVGTYLSEAVDFHRPELLDLQKNLEGGTFDEGRLSRTMPPDHQSFLRSIQIKLTINFMLAKISSMVRFFTELLLPTAAISLVVYLEYSSTVDLIAKLVYGPST